MWESSVDVEVSLEAVTAVTPYKTHMPMKIDKLLETLLLNPMMRRHTSRTTKSGIEIYRNHSFPNLAVKLNDSVK